MRQQKTGSEARRAIRRSIAAQMMGGILPVLLQRGGLTALLIIALIGEDSQFEIGLAFSIIQWSLIARLLSAPRVDVTWRKSHLVRWTAVATGCAILLASVPIVGTYGSPRLAVWLFVVLLAVYCLAWHVGMAAWFPLLSHIVPSSLRGRYFGTMRRSWQITGFLAVIVCGATLGHDPSPARFIYILVPAGLFQLGRTWLYATLPNPPPARSRVPASYGKDIARPFRDPSFRRFLLFLAPISLALWCAMPFLVPFLKSDLGFPTSVTLYATACIGLGSILSLVAWGRLADRWGNRITFVLGMGCNAAAYFLFALSPGFAVSRAGAFATAAAGLLLLGAGTSGIGIAYTVRLMHHAPDEHSGPYLSAGQSAFGVLGGVVALVTGFALSRLPGALLISGTAIATPRFLFAGVAVIFAILIFEIRKLPPLEEPGLQDILGSLRESLPGPLTWPLAPVQRLITRASERRDAAAGDDTPA